MPPAARLPKAKAAVAPPTAGGAESEAAKPKPKGALALVAASTPAACADNSANAEALFTLAADLQTIRGCPVFADINQAPPHDIDDTALSGFQRSFCMLAYEKAMKSLQKKYKAGIIFSRTCFSAQHRAYHCASPASTGWSPITFKSHRLTRWT